MGIKCFHCTEGSCCSANIVNSEMLKFSYHERMEEDSEMVKQLEARLEQELLTTAKFQQTLRML